MMQRRPAFALRANFEALLATTDSNQQAPDCRVSDGVFVDLLAAACRRAELQTFDESVGQFGLRGFAHDAPSSGEIRTEFARRILPERGPGRSEMTCPLAFVVTFKLMLQALLHIVGSAAVVRIRSDLNYE